LNRKTAKRQQGRCEREAVGYGERKKNVEREWGYRAGKSLKYVSIRLTKETKGIRNKRRKNTGIFFVILLF
jgi:hypothetical protein